MPCGLFGMVSLWTAIGFFYQNFITELRNLKSKSWITGTGNFMLFCDSNVTNILINEITDADMIRFIGWF